MSSPAPLRPCVADDFNFFTRLRCSERDAFRVSADEARSVRARGSPKRRRMTEGSYCARYPTRVQSFASAR